MNYYNTLIEVADDCPTKRAQVPQARDSKKTKAVVEYEVLVKHPYSHTEEVPWDKTASGRGRASTRRPLGTTSQVGLVRMPGDLPGHRQDPRPESQCPKIQRPPKVRRPVRFK